LSADHFANCHLSLVGSALVISQKPAALLIEAETVANAHNQV